MKPSLAVPGMRSNRFDHRGVALIMVLWMVAALSIAVMGIVHAMRSETRVLLAQRQMLQLQARGEAVVALMLQELSLSQPAGQLPWAKRTVVFDGQTAQVEMWSVNGWVDVAQASPALLQTLFATAGGVGSAQAKALAQAVVKWREPDAVSGAESRMNVVEDLMRVPGMSYDLYARLRPLVFAHAQGVGKVNPAAAPLDVLVVLTGGNRARAVAMDNARRAGGTGMDATTLQPEFVDNVVGSLFLFRVLLPLADGSVGVYESRVDRRPDSRSGLPWRIFETATWTQAAATQANPQ